MKSIHRTDSKMLRYPRRTDHKSTVPVVSQPTYLSHNCLKYFLSLGLLSGVFPLEGLTYMDPSGLKFKFLSLKMLYTVLLFTVYAFFCILACIKSFSSEMVTNRLISPLFYLQISGIILISTKIAKAWPKYMIKLYQEETNFFRRYKIDMNLTTKLNVTILLATVAVMVEHVLATLNFVFSNDCVNDAEGFERYVRKHFHFIFVYLPYNTFCGIILVVIGWIAMYIWNFGDLLMILTCIILTARFDQVKEKIDWYVKSPNTNSLRNIMNICPNGREKMCASFWKSVREDYDELCHICSRANDLLADMVVFSYTCNLAFILIQLFVSLRDRDRFIEKVFFLYSFAFVVARTLMLSIHGGWLNEASKAALFTLNAVPTEMYNPEISRLIRASFIGSV